MRRVSGLYLTLTLSLLIASPVLAATVTPKSPTDKVSLRIRQQIGQIRREEKLGNLTKDQSKSLRAQVKAINKQELAFLKQDNSKQLTDAQVAQLNDQLNSLSKSIPIK